MEEPPPPPPPPASSSPPPEPPEAPKPPLPPMPPSETAGMGKRLTRPIGDRGVALEDARQWKNLAARPERGRGKGEGEGGRRWRRQRGGDEAPTTTTW